MEMRSALTKKGSNETEAYLKLMEGLMAERPLSHEAEWYITAHLGRATATRQHPSKGLPSSSFRDFTCACNDMVTWTWTWT